MHATTQPAVTVRGLRKTYDDVVAVADVSFDVEAGEILGLLGPNGSGKTTTVECLQGLRRADAGIIDVLGLDPRTDVRRLRRLVGSQLQDSALPDRLKVWEALRLFSRMSPHGPPWERLLDDWGLAGRRNTSFGDLSGGQRQRLFVALALANDPKLVILDEMTTGLDPAARRVAWELVEAVRDRGTTVILVTHSMEEAAHLCDRLIVMRAGHVVATGSPAELVEHASTAATVTFSVAPALDLAFLDAVEGVTQVVRDGPHVTVVGTGWRSRPTPWSSTGSRHATSRPLRRRSRTPTSRSPPTTRRHWRWIMRELVEMTLVEFKLFLRDPLTVVFVLVLPVAVLVILNGIFGNVPDEYFGGLGAVDFYTPAYVTLVVATIGVLAIPVQMAAYRQQGVLRRFRASPMPLLVLLAAHVLIAVIIGTLAAGLLVGLSILVYGGAPPAGWVGIGAAFLLVTVAFASVGVLLGVLLPTVRAAQGVGVLLFFLFMNLGGAGPPPQLLPDAMVTVGRLVPVTPASDLLRGLWLGLGWKPTAAIAMATIVVFSLLIGAWRLRQE